MPFTRRQVYAGNGNLRRLRKSEPARALPVTTNSERERFVQDRFEDAVKAVLATPHLQFSHLVRLLQDPRHGPIEILDKFPWKEFERTFRESEKVLVEQLISGGETASAELFYNFDSRDANVLIWGARHAAEMVTHITEEQRQLLRNHVMNSHLSGIAPKQLAREIREIIGLTPQWQNAVTKYHRGLLDREVDEKFAAKQAARYHDRLLMARAKMIARTEVMRAENEGKLLGWQQAIGNGFLTGGGKKRWHTAITNVCPICLPMDGAESDLDSTFRVATANGKSWDVRTPPSHPNCRCTLTYVPPSVEMIADEHGLDIPSLISEIQQGTYIPDENEDDGFGDSAGLRLVPDPGPDPTPAGIPDPPRFTRRGEAQAWADAHLSDTGEVETIIEWKPTGSVTTTRPVRRHIDFEDLDVAATQELVDAAVHYSRTYPEVWATVHRYGTLQAIYRDQPGYPTRVGGNTWAQATSEGMTGRRTLGVNKVWFTKPGMRRYAKSYADSLASGWHPPTPLTTPTRATLDHEFGHVLTYFIADTIPDAVDSLKNHLERFTGHPPAFWDLSSLACQRYIQAELSEYAISNWHEFVAEAYTHAVNSSTPSPLAQAVLAWVRDNAR